MPLDRLLGKKDATVEPVVSVEAAAQLEELEVLKTAMAEKEAEMASMLAASQEQATALADAQAALATMQAEATQAKEDGRKAKLSAVLPEDQVEGMQASLASLADEQFDTVLAGLATSQKAKLATDDFIEVGSVGAEVEAGVEASIDEDATDLLIAQKYS